MKFAFVVVLSAFLIALLDEVYVSVLVGQIYMNSHIFLHLNGVGALLGVLVYSNVLSKPM